MSNLLQELEAKIDGLANSTVTKSNVGTVREIGDGVARIEGLGGVMLNEMLEFPGGLYGLALNLEETEVGAIILGDYTTISEGDEVKTTGRLLQVPVGKELLGRVVDALGQPIDGKGPCSGQGQLSRREDRPRHHQAPLGQPAAGHRHHVGRRHDPDRPRSARAHHRRPRHRQDHDRHRHDHQPGQHQPRRRGLRRFVLPPRLQHLRSRRPEERRTSPASSTRSPSTTR